MWLPDYADAIVPPLASVGAPAQAPSAFMQWPFLPSLDEAASSSGTGTSTGSAATSIESTGTGSATSTGSSAASAGTGAAHTASTLSGFAAAAVFEPARLQRLARSVARDARAMGFHVLGSGM